MAEPTIEEALGLIIIAILRRRGNKISLTADELREAINFELHSMEIDSGVSISIVRREDA